LAVLLASLAVFAGLLVLRGGRGGPRQAPRSVSAETRQPQARQPRAPADARVLDAADADAIAARAAAVDGGTRLPVADCGSARDALRVAADPGIAADLSTAGRDAGARRKRRSDPQRLHRTIDPFAE
jgi:hypothetical protein